MVYALGLDIAARIAFDLVGVETSTNWCIFIHFFDYIAWSGVYLHLGQVAGMPMLNGSLIDKHRKLIWYWSIAMGMYFTTQAFIQLTYINETWDLYNKGYFQNGYEFSHSVAILIGVAAFWCVKILKKNNLKLKWV